MNRSRIQELVKLNESNRAAILTFPDRIRGTATEREALEDSLRGLWDLWCVEEVGLN